MHAKRNRNPSTTFTLLELLQIRDSVGAEIDILDEELEDPKNKVDLSISRSDMLKKYERCTSILDKVNAIIRKGQFQPSLLNPHAN